MDGGVENRGDRLRRGGLADTGLPLEEQRTTEPDGEEERGREAVVDEVVDGVERRPERGGVGDELCDRVGGGHTVPDVSASSAW